MERPVTYILNNSQVIRSKPSHFKVSKSEKLKSNKSKFSMCTKFSQRIKHEIIRKIWDEKAKKMKAPYVIYPNRSRRPTGHNLFMSRNLQLFNEKALYVDQERLILTTGHRTRVDDFKAERDSGNKEMINVSFKDNSHMRISINKDFLCIVAAIENDIYFFNLPEITRELGGGTFHFPKAANQKTRLWAYFESPDGKRFSESRTVIVI